MNLGSIIFTREEFETVVIVKFAKICLYLILLISW